MEIIPCYFRRDRAFKVLFKGKEPDFIQRNKTLTKREWQSPLGKAKKKNPIFEGYKYLECLEGSHKLKYRDVANKFNVTKARVSQMITLVKKLPPEIIDYVAENDKAGYFT
jgi:hypothetical protein